MLFMPTYASMIALCINGQYWHHDIHHVTVIKGSDMAEKMKRLRGMAHWKGPFIHCIMQRRCTYSRDGCAAVLPLVAIG